jgi:hypothetical protein
VVLIFLGVASRRSGDQAGATPVYHVHNSGGPDVSTFITAAARIPKDRVEHMLGDQDAINQIE